MKIAEISPVTLKDISDEELLSLHRRLHQLWGKHFEGNTKESAGNMTREDLTSAHQFVREEMERRDMKHDSPLGDFGRLALGLPDGVELPGQIMVVPQFVSLVGSSVTGDDGDDVDVLLRTEEKDGKLTLWGDNVHLPLRKVLDPEKLGYLHFIANPQGPHADALPLYDLMLVRAERAELTEGLYLVEPHAKMVWTGKKQSIVKSRKFDVESKRYVLVGDGLAYGYIQLDEAIEIDLDEFREIRADHRITEEERKEWWPDYDKLYLYGIKAFDKFKTPRKVKVPCGVQTFIKDVKLAGAGGSIKIDLGCGKNKPAGYIGLDNRAFPGVDILYDLELGLPFR
nr:hypothetical protein [Chloroflexota bacterium]